MQVRNLAKPFSIAGFIFGEIYMLLVCLAPYRKGPPVPLTLAMPPLEPSSLAPGTPIPFDALAIKIAVSSIFFGPFGAMIGLGVGLLIGGGLLRLSRLRRSPTRADSELPKT